MILNCWTCKMGVIKDGVCKCNIHLLEKGIVVEVKGRYMDLNCPCHSDYVRDCEGDDYFLEPVSDVSVETKSELGKSMGKTIELGVI